MKLERTLPLGLTICAVLAGHALAAGTPAPAIDCRAPATTFDMLHCGAKELRRVEHKLAAVQEQIKRQRPELRTRLVRSEKLWPLYREQQCSLLAALRFAGGSLENVSYQGCKVHLARQRLQQLEGALHNRALHNRALRASPSRQRR